MFKNGFNIKKIFLSAMLNLILVLLEMQLQSDGLRYFSNKTLLYNAFSKPTLWVLNLKHLPEERF